MHSRYLVILWVACATLFHGSSWASLFRPEVRNFSPKEYGTQQNPEVWAVVQAPDHVMYFGSNHGVLQFDGTTWNFIPVKPGQVIVSLDVDASGRVYVGGLQEFGFISEDENGFMQYTSISEQLENQDFGTIWRTFHVGDRTYFQSESMLFMLDGDELVVITPPEEHDSFHLAMVLGDEVWIRVRWKGLFKLVDRKLVFIDGTEPLGKTGVFGGLVTSSGEHMLVTGDDGIQLLSSDNKLNYLGREWTMLLRDAEVLGVQRLSGNDLAIHTVRAGVIIVDDSAKVVMNINETNGAASNDVKGIREDVNGNLWLATQNGISMIAYELPMEVYDQVVGLRGNVQCLAENEHGLFVGTSTGLFGLMDFWKGPNEIWNELNHRQSARPVASARFFQVENWTQVWDLELNGELLHVASQSGYDQITNPRPKWNTTTGPSLPPGKGPFASKAVDFDDQWNQTVVITEYGVTIWSGDSDHNTYSSGNIGRRNFPEVINLIQDPSKGAIKTYWAGTMGAGVVRIQVSKDSIHGVDLFNKDFGLHDQLVIPFTYEGKAYFGTRAGVMQLQMEQFEDGSSFEFFEMLMVNDEPWTDPISGFYQDSTHCFAIVNNEIAEVEGLGRLNFNHFQHLNHGRINFITKGHNGNLWIGTAEGLIKMSSSQDKSDVPLITCNRISFKDSVVLGSEQLMDVSVPHGWNDLRVSVSLPFFNHGGRNQYSYRMAGYNDSWSDWNSSGQFNLTNIHEGQYTLEIKARTAEGVTSEIWEFSFNVAAPWYRSALAYLFYFIGLVGIVLIAVRISSARLRRQNEKLEATVQERTAEIVEKNKVLETQKAEIFHQKEEITASINYASRIQRAILPEIATFEGGLADFFILYTPRDIVSGDFYWFADTPDGKVIVCADCTGHGVPGAFMSMIGADQLNHTVLKEGITHPSEILASINRGIKKSLKQTGEEGTTKDGMDAAVIRVNPETRAVEYAGANRPLWIIRNGELEDHKATKVAIAGFTEEDQVFDLQTFELNEGDAIYMFSDGYPDQFGGPKGKKFMNKRLKELLVEIYQKPMAEQHDLLNQAIVDWMGDEEQVDDICVIGVRL